MGEIKSLKFWNFREKNRDFSALTKKIKDFSTLTIYNSNFYDRFERCLDDWRNKG